MILNRSFPMLPLGEHKVRIDHETAIFDNGGEFMEYDEDGFCLNEYAVVGSEEPSPYYAMIYALA